MSARVTFPMGAGTGSPSPDATNELRDAANRAVMNRLLEGSPSAPAGLDIRTGVALQVSRKDQQEAGVVSRTAFRFENQLYIQDTVMKSNGDTEEKWRRGTRPLSS